MSWRLPCLLSLACLLCLLVGCGGDGTNRVSGKITFKGQPVPAGTIHFIPDGKKGNKGATGYAVIKDGAYDTSARGGRGSVSGPVIIAVEGIDPSGPPPKAAPDVTTTVLFPWYELPFDMPASATTKNIDVPAEAAKGPKKPAGKPGEIIP